MTNKRERERERPVTHRISQILRQLVLTPHSREREKERERREREREREKIN